MSRLPPALQLSWPIIKRVHRFLALVTGTLLRRLWPVLGVRGVPRTATTTSIETARSEPHEVVVHPAGPEEEIVRSRPPGSPARHWRFEGARTATVPATYVLDVRRGRLVSDYGATVTPGNVLDYQTSGYFGISSWREHPVYLAPLRPSVHHVDGTALSLVARGATGNYYHFLYDAVARYGLFEEALPDERLDAVIVPHQARYQRELLELAGITSPFLQPRRGLTYVADRLLVPSTPNQDLDAPRRAATWLRKRLPPTGSGGGPTRLYLTRGARPNSRRYVQEEELWPWLQDHGFVRLDPGTLSVQEQIDIFHGAEVVVGPHGAALTNLTFCRPGTKVLEMFAASYVHLGLWTICEAVGGIDYHYLVADGDHRPGRPMTGVLDDVSIPPATVQACLEEILEDR